MPLREDGGVKVETGVAAVAEDDLAAQLKVVRRVISQDLVVGVGDPDVAAGRRADVPRMVEDLDRAHERVRRGVDHGDVVRLALRGKGSSRQSKTPLGLT